MPDARLRGCACSCARAARADPLPRTPRALAAAFLAPVFDGAGAAARDFAPLAPLVCDLGILAAPAALLGRIVVENLADLLDQIFRQAGFGHKGIAPGALRPFGDARERVAGQ